MSWSPNFEGKGGIAQIPGRGCIWSWGLLVSVHRRCWWSHWEGTCPPWGPKDRLVASAYAKFSPEAQESCEVFSSLQTPSGKVWLKTELCLKPPINLYVNMTDTLQVKCTLKVDCMGKAACYLQCTPPNPNSSQLVLCPVKYPIHKAKKVIFIMITFVS